jgi:ABC-2 type transport system ATP-binding protein
MSERIALSNLTKRFGPLTAVDGIDMSVTGGEVLGFLGPNGAGKSTTMKMITGFLTPTSGTAHVDGIDVVANPVEAKKQIGYLPEGAPCYGDMTPTSFLNFIADIRQLKGAERKSAINIAIDRVDISGVLDQPIETLSKGFKRRVGLAQAILHNPPILILDEPTDGLDPNQKHQVRTLIQEMASDKAVIISTHILEEVEAVCSRAVIIARGKMLADGTPAELVQRSELHNAVYIDVAPDAADAIASDIRKLDTVNEVSMTAGAAGLQKLRVTSKGGQSIAIDVAAILKEKGHAASDLTTQQGALDAVFREITQGPHTTNEGEVTHG